MIAPPSRSPAKWPGANVKLIDEIASSGIGLVDLWEASPVRLDSNDPQTKEIIALLFPGNPLLCCAWRRHHFDTRPRTTWHKLHTLEFIVPCPMTARTGRTKDGKLSAHSLENTGPRWFLVVEFDSGSVDTQASVLLHLAERAPMALVVHSGGKSLHGWFYCEGCAGATLTDFMRTAAELGSDTATFDNHSQFVRMPDGRRANGKRQTVFFFNPEVVS